MNFANLATLLSSYEIRGTTRSENARRHALYVIHEKQAHYKQAAEIGHFQVPLCICF